MSSIPATSTTPAAIMAANTVLPTAARSLFAADAVDLVCCEWFLRGHEVVSVVGFTGWTKPTIAQLTRLPGGVE